MKEIIIYWLIFLPLLLLGQERYEIAVEKELVIESKKVALKQVGILETGQNRGKEIDVYNQIIGNPLGSPYCQAGQYYCYYIAYLNLKWEIKNHPVPRNGLANSTFDYAKKVGKKSKKYYAKENDFIIWKEIDSYFGHIERINKVGKAGWVETIGFNVSQNGKEGVFICKRNIKFPLTRIKKIRGIVGIVYE
jgi:hypothetical protein